VAEALHPRLRRLGLEVKAEMEELSERNADPVEVTEWARSARRRFEGATATAAIEGRAIREAT
jgi:hypothetical protein